MLQKHIFPQDIIYNSGVHAGILVLQKAYRETKDQAIYIALLVIIALTNYYPHYPKQTFCVNYLLALKIAPSRSIYSGIFPSTTQTLATT